MKQTVFKYELSNYNRPDTYQEARLILMNQICAGGYMTPILPIVLIGSGNNGKSYLINDLKLEIKECNYVVFQDDINKIPIESKKAIYCMNSMDKILDLQDRLFIIDMNLIVYNQNK